MFLVQWDSVNYFVNSLWGWSLLHSSLQDWTQSSQWLVRSPMFCVALVICTSFSSKCHFWLLIASICPEMRLFIFSLYLVPDSSTLLFISFSDSFLRRFFSRRFTLENSDLRHFKIQTIPSQLVLFYHCFPTSPENKEGIKIYTTIYGDNSFPSRKKVEREGKSNGAFNTSFTDYNKMSEK